MVAAIIAAGGGSQPQTPGSTTSASSVMKKGNLFQVPHYFGVEIAELLSGTGNPTLPRLLVYLCEYLLSWSSRSTPATILGWVNSNPTTPGQREQLKAVRDQFDTGNFYDCKSPETVFNLLRTFFRELPSGLIPSADYEQCMDIVSESLKKSIAALRRNRLYKLLIRRFGPEMDAVVERVKKTKAISSFLLICTE